MPLSVLKLFLDLLFVRVLRVAAQQLFPNIDRGSKIPARKIGYPKVLQSLRVVGVDLQAALIGLDCLGDLTLVQLGSSQIGPDVEVFRVELQDLLVPGNGRIEPSHIIVCVA